MKYISPIEVSSKSKVKEEDCLLVLDTLSDMGVLKARLMSICPVCDKVNGKYNTIDDVPICFKCEACGTKTNEILKNTYLVFENILF